MSWDLEFEMYLLKRSHKESEGKPDVQARIESQIARLQFNPEQYARDLDRDIEMYWEGHDRYFGINRTLRIV